MALALVAEAEATDSSLNAYVSIDKRVDGAEGDALLARWEFGRMLLTERIAHGGYQLPHGRINQLSVATGKSPSELKYRAQFAEQYPTPDKVANALATFRSWHGIVKEGLVTEPKARVPEVPPPITEDDLWRAIENRLIEIETVIGEFKTRKHPNAAPLFAGLATFARVVRDAKH